MAAREPLTYLIALTLELEQDRSAEQVLERATVCAQAMLSANAAAAFLFGPETAASFQGPASSSLAQLVGPPGEHPAIGLASQQEGALVIADLSSDQRFSEARGDSGERSLAAIALRSAGKVVGVLMATHCDVGHFGQPESGLLRLVASCICAGLSGARSEVEALARLEHALASPLRLRLVAELVEAGDMGLTLEDAVLRSARHPQHVQACLEPLVVSGQLQFDGQRYRLTPSLAAEQRALIDAHLARGAEDIGRERHVRHGLLGGMIGIDPKMHVVFELARQVARIDVPVLITGETGTGKELIARAIHDLGPRRNGFFGAINCATLSETLFDSQMFGHVRGTSGDATRDYVGMVPRCAGGTLFLEEVGELTLGNQVKLLRFLEEGTFCRVGESEASSSDFRLITATHRDLNGLVAAGSFREDLYHRLVVYPIRVPSLRERLDDLVHLVDGLLALQSQRYRTGAAGPSITPEALLQLAGYHWPGNVRELENVMARALVMAGGGVIGPEHLPEIELLSDAPPDSEMPADSGEFEVPRTLEDVQREHIVTTLRSLRGNIKATAQVLGISRTTLYKKIRDYQIDAPV